MPVKVANAKPLATSAFHSLRNENIKKSKKLLKIFQNKKQKKRK